MQHSVPGEIIYQVFQLERSQVHWKNVVRMMCETVAWIVNKSH